jgi:epoxyqueuosine reductase
MRPAEQTAFIVESARALGLDLCGVAPADDYSELARLPEWLSRGCAGEMHYLADPRRGSPSSAMPGARSIIVCALNYNTDHPYSTEVAAHAESDRGWISRYAWGEDYHLVLKKKLEALLDKMRARFGESFDARAYVDTGPIVERVAAKHAGLGWLGKNTCLIHEQLGSWFFLGVILTTLDLAPSLGPADSPPADLCGNCTLCLDACPTGVLTEPYTMDARLCISYLTIELRGAVPEHLREPMGRHIFGCDICQDVCPWNRRAAVSPAPEFQPRQIDSRTLLAPELEWLLGLAESDFQRIFRKSAVKRAKWQGLVRNACIALGNSAPQPGTPAQDRVAGILKRLAAFPDPVVAESAEWALSRIE